MLIEELTGILRHAKADLLRMPDSGAIVRRGGAFGDLVFDTETRADLEIGSKLCEAFSLITNVACVSVEGQEERTVRPEGLWVTVDPVDGSLNQRCRGTAMGFPYVCCVTVLERRKEARFDDVILTGIIDLRPASTDLWIASFDGDRYYSYLHLDPIQIENESRLDLGSQVVLGEMFYPEHREKLVRAFAGQKGSLRSLGSAAYEMASVASGQAVAFICDRQKQHELGAGYALVKGAGGVAVDWHGHDLGSHHYSFTAQTPVVLAANMRIAEDILSLISLNAGHSF